MKKIALPCIALILILVSGRCRFSSHAFGGRDGSYIRMSNGDVHEEIKYDGQIKFTEDETGIDHISPNGYLMFIRNDEKLTIESNYHGQLLYEINDGGKKTSLNENEKKVLQELIHEMLAFGFDAEGRADRIYKKGGNSALLQEIHNLNADNTKEIYFERILNSDSISEEDLTMTIKKIASEFGSDYAKEKLLNHSANLFLKHPETVKAYLEAIEALGSDYSKETLLTQLISRQAIAEVNFEQFMKVVDGLGSDNAKENLLRILIDKQQLSADSYDHLFASVGRLGSDNAKENLLRQMMEKKAIMPAQFDHVTQIISMMGSDNQKSNLCLKLIETENLSDEQWITIINSVTHLGSDNEKANLLIEIAKRMSTAESVRSAYLAAAKTLGSDSEFGRVIKELK